MNSKKKAHEIKIVVIIASMAMLMVGFVIVGVSNDTSATGNNGLAEYKFFVGSYESEEWDAQVGVGYNAYIALQDAFSNVSATTNGATYTKIVTSPYGDYITINPEYGTIASIGSLSAGNDLVWNIFMYNNQNQWVRGPVDALGFYQGYSDYDSSLRTANIVLYLGEEDADIDDVFDLLGDPTGLESITFIDNSDCYKVTFTINVDTTMDQPYYLSTAEWEYLQGLNGTVVFGYGSNCYTAFQNALSSVYGNSCMYDPLDHALSSDDYGYVSSIYGIQENHLSTPQSWWWYWSLHTGAPSGSNYSSFTAGFLTPLTGLTGFQYSALYFNYEVSVY